MEQRRLGRSDLRISRIGLGTWAMGGAGWKFGWGAQEREDSLRTIREACAAGINWIDTAPVYGLGYSEEVVGEALEGVRERPLIATKCGRRWDENGVPYGDLSRASILRELDDSLRRLKVEVIDLYQLHWPLPDEQIEEAWGAMAEGVAAGKVRWLGVSNCSADQIRRLLPIHPVISVQPPYSMLKRDIENELLPFCAANDIGVICYSPMQKGILSDKFSLEWVERLPADDHRRGDALFNQPALERNLRLVDGLRAIAKAQGRTVAQLAIAWTLRRPEVTAAIVGSRRPEQLAETTAASTRELSDDELSAIDALLAAA